MTADQIVRRQDQMLTRREKWLETWADVAELVVPSREGFMGVRQSTKPYRGNRIYDTTAVRAAQMMADGIQGYLLTPGKSFFQSRLSDLEIGGDKETRLWLRSVDKLLHKKLQNSTFYNAASEFFLDGVSFGVGVMSIEEELGTDNVRFRAIHPREITISDNWEGVVDTVYREFEMSSRNLVSRFPDTVPDYLHKEAEQNPEHKHWVIRAIQPHEESRPGARVYDCYVLKKDRIKLEEREHNSSPLLVWRFKTASGEVYGRSPATDHMALIKRLNSAAKAKQIASQKVVDPPYIVSGKILNRFSTNPGWVVRSDDPNVTAQPLMQGYRPEIAIEEINSMQQELLQAYRTDFFVMMAQMSASREMTAAEIVERSGEKAAMLGSMLGGLYKQFLDPSLDRVFEILAVKGLVPPLPMSLIQIGPDGRPTPAPVDLQMDYLGPLAQAQNRHFQTQGARTALMGIAETAQIGGPSVLDNFDFDEFVRIRARAEGLPEEAMRDDAAIRQIRQARQQQQQQVQQMQMQAAQAQIAKDLKGTPAEEAMGL